MKQVDKFTTPAGGYRYTQDGTGVPFHAFTWQALIGAVAAHRLAESLDLSLGWEERVEDEACRQNGWECVEGPSKEALYGHLQEVGRALWHELHAFAHAYPESPTETDKQQALAWIKNWHDRVPNYGCGCRDHASRFMSGWAPDVSSRAALIRYTECFHDWVNRRTNHPFWNEEQYKASPAVDI
jgi:hypothetical protein